MDIGKRIAEKRESAGLKQAELAKKVGALQKDISRWENGKHAPSIENLKKIADALGCAVDDLLN